jgi:thiol-disulfide isomerase/thioredoxin
VVAVVSTVLVLTGCGDDQPNACGTPTSTQPPTSEAPPSQPAQAASTVTPPQAPNVPEQLGFTGTTVDGQEFSGESLAGKPALLWFWAPWCPKCQAEAPTIAEAVRTASGIQFVGVAAQDQVPAMQDFVERFHLGSFPHLADTDAVVWKRFGVTYQPACAFIISARARRRAPLMGEELAYALGAGMIATVNPCGFARLPGYLTMVIAADQDATRIARLGRALAANALMTVGFVAVFGVFGVFGLLSAPLASSLQQYCRS